MPIAIFSRRTIIKLTSYKIYFYFLNKNIISRFQYSFATLFTIVRQCVLTTIPRIWHIGVYNLGPIEERHEKVIFAFGVGARHSGILYDSRTFCRIRACYSDEQQQSGVVHDPNIMHLL